MRGISDHVWTSRHLRARFRRRLWGARTDLAPSAQSRAAHFHVPGIAPRRPAAANATGRRSGRAGALPPNSTDALLEVAELTGHGPEPAHLPERLWIEPHRTLACLTELPIVRPGY